MSLVVAEVIIVEQHVLEAAEKARESRTQEVVRWQGVALITAWE
jgi:hypothetical protein